jgi:hypothetical protein
MTSAKVELTPAGDLFNNQQLLFDRTELVTEAGKTQIPEQYYRHGWSIVDNIADECAAIKYQAAFINSIDKSKVPFHERFHNRIQLAKADQIPVCDDIIASSFQVLHFDMGHPFLESEGQLFISHVGIYLSRTTEHTATARTRIVELAGLLKYLLLSPQTIENQLTGYVGKYGDGWEDHNTYRLACFMRFLDALSHKPELKDHIDKTVGQWFHNNNKIDEQSAYQHEAAFYAKHGIDLSKFEHQVTLKPGQLLILDNVRVVHGRIGKRTTKELFNFMWGIEAIKSEDVATLRQFICKLVTSS